MRVVKLHPSSSKTNQGSLYLYSCFKECWDREAITPIEKVCTAACEVATGVTSSIAEIGAIRNETSRDQMKSLWKSLSRNCETFLCSRSIALRRIGDNKKFLFWTARGFISAIQKKI